MQHNEIMECGVCVRDKTWRSLVAPSVCVKKLQILQLSSYMRTLGKSEMGGRARLESKPVKLKRGSQKGNIDEDMSKLVAVEGLRNGLTLADLLETTQGAGPGSGGLP